MQEISVQASPPPSLSPPIIPTPEQNNLGPSSPGPSGPNLSDLPPGGGPPE